MKTPEEILEYVEREVERLREKSMESRDNSQIEFLEFVSEQTALLKLKIFILSE